MRLSLYDFHTGAETAGGHRVVYDIAADTAFYGEAHVEGHALVWQLDDTLDDAAGALLSHRVQLDPFAEWLVRCERVDFPLGAVLPRHTHAGPGIRYLLRGSLAVVAEGRSASYGPGSAWFEAGLEPVVVRASQHAETSFVRVLVLPADRAGRSTAEYLDPADRDRPGLETVTVHLEHRLPLQ